MHDHFTRRRIADRHLFADHIIVRYEDRLAETFGTAWEFVGGRAFHTCTHSRFDVLDAATRLAAVLGLDPSLVPLVRLAAVLHAHDGRCGDGAEAAARELSRWPASVFDRHEPELLAGAIHNAGPEREGWTAPSPVTERLAAHGQIDAERFRGLAVVDQLAAILVDADHAHLGQRLGMHRTLLRIVEWHRDLLAVPLRSDGSRLTPDIDLVISRLAEAADAYAAHRFLLGPAEQLFPLRDGNVERIRAAIEALRDGRESWQTLLRDAGWDGSKR